MFPVDLRDHPRKAPIVRFMALVRINADGCWDWLGSKSKDGYGQFVLDGRRSVKRVRISPYRFIWEYINGPMPEGTEPDHTCNNRGCCNPVHVEPVTHSENQKRSYARGRKRPGRDYAHPRHHPTHCKHGHAYTLENTRINSQGGMVCRICERRRVVEYQARKKAA